MRITLLLLFLSFINAQIALPTFQAVHKPHNTSSSNSNLEDIFGSATEFTLMGSNSLTNHFECTGWGDISGNASFFISYINITTSTVTTYQTTQLATNGNGITATGATNASSGYNPSLAIQWSSYNKGVWWSGNNANTGVLTATMSGGWGTNRGIQIRYWTGGHHKCYLIKVTANSITRFFAPKDIANPGGTSNHVFYPLNDTFTSFTDSRLTSLGTNDSVLPDSYFEYAP